MLQSMGSQRVGNDLATELTVWLGFPGGSMVKNLPTNAGDAGSIPQLGRSPGEGNGKLLQYSCLVNPMDRGAWQAHKRVRNDLATKQQQQSGI